MHGQNVHVGHYTKLACNMHCNTCMYIMQVTCICMCTFTWNMHVQACFMQATCTFYARYHHKNASNMPWHYVFQGHHQWKAIINTTLALTEKHWLPGTEKGTHFLQWTTLCLVKNQYFVRIPCESELQVTWEPSVPQIMYPVWVGKGFSGEKKVQVPREATPVQVTWTVW